MENMVLWYGGGIMKKYDFLRLKYFREKMHLRVDYLAEVLSCSIIDYELMEEGKLEPSEDQLRILGKIYNVSEEHFHMTLESRENVLARTESEITENDKKQIAEFLIFQRKSGKKTENREFVISEL